MTNALLSYKDKFPEPGFDINTDLLDKLLDLGFIDASWENDSCPAFQRGCVKVWTGGTHEDAGGYTVEIVDLNGEQQLTTPLSVDGSLEFVAAIEAMVMASEFFTLKFAVAAQAGRAWRALNLAMSELGTVSPFIQKEADDVN